MGILVAKGDPDGAAKVRSFFQIALQRGNETAIGDVADTILASQIVLPELRMPSTHPLAPVADRIFRERKIQTKLVTV